MTVLLYGQYYRSIYYNHKVCSALASVVNYDCKRDAKIWSVNLTTLESSFTIVTCLSYRPQVVLKHTSSKNNIEGKHSSLFWFNVTDEEESFTTLPTEEPLHSRRHLNSPTT